MAEVNLWEIIGNDCLLTVNCMLQNYTPGLEYAKTVKTLVETAVLVQEMLFKFGEYDEEGEDGQG